MTKNILCILAAIGTILLLTVLDSRGQLSITGNAAFTGAAGIGAAASGGGGGGLTQGDVFNESFEGTGYENTWSETSTPDEDYALPGSLISKLGSQGLRINYAGANMLAQHDLTGTVTATRYLRFYLYIASHSLGTSSDRHSVFNVNETADVAIYPRVNVYVKNVGGQLNIYGFSTGASADIPISVTTWYRVEVMSVNNNTTSEIKVFDATSGTQVGSTQTFTSGNYYFRFVNAGRTVGDNVNVMDFTIDGVGVSSSGYLGE